MAKRNYQFEKRKRDIEKKAKKEEKKLRKLQPSDPSPPRVEMKWVTMTKTGKTTGRMPNAALMKPVQPDDALAVIVGSTPLPRGELTKKLWDYIKKNKLQDEKKRTLINADDALKVVFGGKKQVSMFEMTKLVSGHVK